MHAASSFDRRASIVGGASVEATEAETLPKNLRRMSDPSFTPGR